MMIRPHKVYLKDNDKFEIRPPILDTQLFKVKKTNQMSALANNTAQEVFSLKPPDTILPGKPTDYYANVNLPPEEAEDTAAAENITGKSFNPYTFVEHKLKGVNWKNKALAILLYIKNSVDPQILFISQNGTLYFRNTPLVQQAPLELILQGLLDKKKNRTSSVAMGEMQILNILVTAPSPIKHLINVNKINLFEPDLKRRYAAQTKTKLRTDQKPLTKPTPLKPIPNSLTKNLIKAMPAQTSKKKTVASPNLYNKQGFTTATALTKTNRMIVTKDEKKPWFYLN